MPVYWEAIAQGTTALELHDVLTVASIVEREAVLDEERPLIAGVYLNRLARGMRLEADPTVQYAMGFQPDSGQWWKTPVYLEEYSQVISPYNTYLNAGLPPGPIAAPRLASIQAVLNPGPARLPLLRGRARRHRPARLRPHLRGASGERAEVSGTVRSGRQCQVARCQVSGGTVAGCSRRFREPAATGAEVTQSAGLRPAHSGGLCYGC